MGGDISRPIEFRVGASFKRRSGTFAANPAVLKKVVQYGEKEIVFSQGRAATNVLYIQRGGVKPTVVNEAVKRQCWRC